MRLGCGYLLELTGDFVSAKDVIWGLHQWNRLVIDGKLSGFSSEVRVMAF